VKRKTICSSISKYVCEKSNCHTITAFLYSSQKLSSAGWHICQCSCFVCLFIQWLQITIHPSLYVTPFRSEFPSKISRHSVFIWSDSTAWLIAFCLNCQISQEKIKIIHVHFKSHVFLSQFHEFQLLWQSYISSLYRNTLTCCMLPLGSHNLSIFIPNHLCFFVIYCLYITVLNKNSSHFSQPVIIVCLIWFIPVVTEVHISQYMEESVFMFPWNS
jgi:hypothetical protein